MVHPTCTAIPCRKGENIYNFRICLVVATMYIVGTESALRGLAASHEAESANYEAAGRVV